MTAIPANANGRPRNVCAMLVRVDRRCRGGLRANLSSGEALVATLAVISGDPDPGVEDAVHNVDYEVHDDIDSRHEQRHS
jgi:hypothetical protein